MEPVDHVCEAGRGFRQVGCVDLRNIPQTDQLGAGTCARDQGFHLLGGQILSLIDDDEAVQEGAAAHEVQGADLDPVPEQVVCGAASPGAPGLDLCPDLQ